MLTRRAFLAATKLEGISVWADDGSGIDDALSLGDVVQLQAEGDWHNAEVTKIETSKRKVDVYLVESGTVTHSPPLQFWFTIPIPPVH